MWHIADVIHLKLQDIIEPISGILIDREVDDFHTYYLIEQDYGPVIRLSGGIDLRRKMDNADPDDQVWIKFGGWKNIAGGKAMMLAEVNINKNQLSLIRREF
jgi:hypothetical protein